MVSLLMNDEENLLEPLVYISFSFFNQLFSKTLLALVAVLEDILDVDNVSGTTGSAGQSQNMRTIHRIGEYLLGFIFLCISGNLIICVCSGSRDRMKAKSGLELFGWLAFVRTVRI